MWNSVGPNKNEYQLATNLLGFQTVRMMTVVFFFCFETAVLCKYRRQTITQWQNILFCTMIIDNYVLMIDKIGLTK